MKKRILITFVLLVTSQMLFGQMFPERRQVRQGNKQYEQENYTEAESRYMGALSKNPGSYEGNFNLGNTYYKQGRFEEAEQRFQQLGQVPYLPEQWAQTHYNQGNAQVQQYKSTYDKQKLQLALEAYKQSLRLNPDDQEAKFNLAYVQKLLEDDNGGEGGGGNDQNQDQNNDQEQDQNNDQNQDQNNDQNQDQNNDPNQDQNQDQNNDPKQDQQNKDNPNQGQQPQEGRMSQEEAEQMLNAVQHSEDQTREKVDKEQAGTASRSGKNW